VCETRGFRTDWHVAGNLPAASGHPSEVMDMSFANQFLSQIRIAELTKKGKRLHIAVHDIPVEQDQDIVKLKLATMGHNIVTSTPEQLAYMNDYSVGR